jgi:translation initiation factor 1A
MGKKNAKGGKGHRKMGKKNTNRDTRNTLIIKEEGEEYVKVAKMLGGARMYVTFPDGSECICRIPGKMRKRRSWISVGDIILVSIRDYQEDHCDVIHRYTADQVRVLKLQGDITFTLDGFTDRNKDADADIEFDDEAGEDSIQMGTYVSERGVHDNIAPELDQVVPDQVVSDTVQPEIVAQPADTTLEADTDDYQFDISEI